MSLPASSFYFAGGTLRHDAPSYVERQADKDLYAGLSSGEFCYVLTSRQMGKSSLMGRIAKRLRDDNALVVILDLTAIGLNLTPEQWYDGLLIRLGRQLDLEDDLDDFWQQQGRLGPAQRFFEAIREIVLARRPERLIIFVDEIDLVRSLPFATDEFFAAIRECYNRRNEDAGFHRLTFCLLGVATPSELIRNPRTTPFNVGRRIELTDFSETAAAPLAQCLGAAPDFAPKLLSRVFHWTNGHPYLTQRLCRSIADEQVKNPGLSPDASLGTVDSLTDQLFLSARAREQDDNLLFVRERILRSEFDLGQLLDLYARIHADEPVLDNDSDDYVNQLRLAGLVGVQQNLLKVRNRIYHRVFDHGWIAASRPDAVLEKPDGQKVRLQRSCGIGRASTNDVVLSDAKISRRHALVQAQKQHEFWLIDLGSSNGSYLNGKRVTQPALLKDGDIIELGPFRLIFHQSRGPAEADEDKTSADMTLCGRQTIIGAGLGKSA